MREEERWKSLSPPPFVKPAGKCSPAAAALEQKRAGAAWGGSRCCSPRRVSTQDQLAKGIVAKGASGKSGKEERRRQESSLPQNTLASLFLGFGQLRGKASAAHVSCCGVLEPGQG